MIKSNKAEMTDIGRFTDKNGNLDLNAVRDRKAQLKSEKDSGKTTSFETDATAEMGRVKDLQAQKEAAKAALPQAIKESKDGGWP